MSSFLGGKLLTVGSCAPDFTLPDQDGNNVSLAGLRGQNVVLIFYPRDETPVCRRQLCEFRDQFQLAASRDTVVLGVNSAGANSHSRFRGRLSLPFPLLVDAGNQVARLYQAKGLLLPVRTVYLIGRDGRIRYGKRGKPAPEEVLGSAA